MSSREPKSESLRNAHRLPPGGAAANGGSNTNGGAANVEADGRSKTRPGASSRSTIVLIVQRSTIDLFAAYGVTVAPAGPPMTIPWPPQDAVAATIVVSVAGKPGQLELATSRALIERAKPAQAAPAHLDWARELANQLAGRIANRFARYRLPMTTAGVAKTSGTFGTGAQGSRAHGERRVESGVRLLFHAVRDAVGVTLSGGWDEDEIPFELESAAVVPEGDIILF